MSDIFPLHGTPAGLQARQGRSHTALEPYPSPGQHPARWGRWATILFRMSSGMVFMLPFLHEDSHRCRLQAAACPRWCAECSQAAPQCRRAGPQRANWEICDVWALRRPSSSHHSCRESSTLLCPANLYLKTKVFVPLGVTHTPRPRPSHNTYSLFRGFKFLM